MALDAVMTCPKPGAPKALPTNGVPPACGLVGSVTEVVQVVRQMCVPFWKALVSCEERRNGRPECDA